MAEPGGPVLSYRDLHDRVRDTARALIASGIEPGDRVALWSPNTYHWVLAGLGALYAGATLVPVNTRFTGPEALDVINRSNARALVVADQFLGADRHALVAEAAARAGALLPGLVVRIPVEGISGRQAPVHGLGWEEFTGRAGQVSVASAVDQAAAAVTPEDVLDIIFTSGTTGATKGAMSTHRQTIDVAYAWGERAQVTSDDRYLIVNPFFHTFGYKAGFLVCMLGGATIVPMRSSTWTGDAPDRGERITVLPGAPTIYTSILEHPGRGPGTCPAPPRGHRNDGRARSAG